MNFGKLKQTIATPYSILIVTVFASFLAWLTPDFGVIRKGFSQPFSIFSFGFLLAFIWYSTAVFLAFFSYHMATKVKLSSAVFDRYVPLHKKRPYVILTFLASIGCIASLYSIASIIGVNSMIDAVLAGQANKLKYTLYDDYSVGLLSLRYLVIHSCTIALFRRFKLKIKSKLDLLNILQLLFVAVISSRLSLVMTVFATLILFAVHAKTLKIRIVKLFSFGFVLFTLLSIFSYSRNKGFYEAKGQGFWTAGISEIVTYLGAPFQGAVAVGNNHNSIINNPHDWDRYAFIEKNLSTNSAFLQLFQSNGWHSFPIMVFSVIVFSLFAGFLKNQQNNFLYLSVITILYSFAEFWRLYWFGRGIMITLCVFPVIVTIIVILLSKSPWRGMISQ